MNSKLILTLIFSFCLFPNLFSQDTFDEKSIEKIVYNIIIKRLETADSIVSNCENIEYNLSLMKDTEEVKSKVFKDLLKESSKYVGKEELKPYLEAYERNVEVAIEKMYHEIILTQELCKKIDSQIEGQSFKDENEMKAFRTWFLNMEKENAYYKNALAYINSLNDINFEERNCNDLKRKKEQLMQFRTTYNQSLINEIKNLAKKGDVFPEKIITNSSILRRNSVITEDIKNGSRLYTQLIIDSIKDLYLDRDKIAENLNTDKIIEKIDHYLNNRNCN